MPFDDEQRQELTSLIGDALKGVLPQINESIEKQVTGGIGRIIKKELPTLLKPMQDELGNFKSFKEEVMKSLGSDDLDDPATPDTPTDSTTTTQPETQPRKRVTQTQREVEELNKKLAAIEKERQADRLALETERKQARIEKAEQNAIALLQSLGSKNPSDPNYVPLRNGVTPSQMLGLLKLEGKIELNSNGDAYVMKQPNKYDSSLTEEIDLSASLAPLLKTDYTGFIAGRGGGGADTPTPSAPTAGASESDRAFLQSVENLKNDPDGYMKFMSDPKNEQRMQAILDNGY